MGRLKKRLDQLQNHAHKTMGDAEKALLLISDLIQDVHDGITIEIDNPFTSKPVSIGIRIKEEENESEQ